MEGASSRRVLYYTLILPAVFAISSLVFLQTCHALTASYGQPYHGYLVNGVVFPDMFPGYDVRDYNAAYTTPELAGALLDAIEAVKRQFPGSCDVFIGDFSKKGGGPFGGHVSHQNGRDVDVGLYAKDNQELHSLIPMNRDNLDPAKTLCLIANLVASQRVQYIFLDRSIQKILYDYGLSHGYSRAYLNRLFGDVPGALVEDIPGHLTHMHVRFFTPWSTLAANIGPDATKMRSIIAIAQASYMPRKVDYFVSGHEKGIAQLAKSFGVSVGELCAWNHITPFSVLVPGSCLVFYKRSFESGPVLLANSLQPGYIAQAAAPPVRVASIEPQSAPTVMSDSVNDDQISNQAQVPLQQASASGHSGRAYRAYRTNRTYKADRTYKPDRTYEADRTHEAHRAEARASVRPALYYTVKHGGTLKDVARETGMSLYTLSRLNHGLSINAPLRPGYEVRLADAVSVGAIRNTYRGGSSPICFASESGKAGMTAAYYRVANGGTLKDVAMRTGIPLSSLCRLNRLSSNAPLRRGQLIKLAQANLPVRPALGRSACGIKYPVRKTFAGRHEKYRKRFLKSAKAKFRRKPVAASRSLIRRPAIRRRVEAVKTYRKRAVHSRTKAKTAARRHSRYRLAKR